MNTLYYGDNLKILRDLSERGAIATGFRVRDKEKNPVITITGSDQTDYPVLFRNESGSDSESQITAFEDTWHWNLAAEQTYNELINEPDPVGRMIESFRQFIGTNQMMAYLVMMAVRLKERNRA